MQPKDGRTKSQIIEALRGQLPYLRDRYGVSRLALFGSHATGKARPSSDVDLLVELDRPLGLDFVTMADDLEMALGKKVDIATFESFNRSLAHPRFRSIAENVERDLVYVD